MRSRWKSAFAQNHRRTIGHGGSESAAPWGEALLSVISTAIRFVRAWSTEATEEFFGRAFDDFAESGGGFHMLGAEAFVSAAHIPEEVAGWLEGDIGNGEIDGFHAEVEFIIDTREAGEALGGGLGIEEVFRPLGLDGNEVGGDFLCGEFAGPDEGAEWVDGGGGSGSPGLRV